MGPKTYGGSLYKGLNLVAAALKIFIWKDGPLFVEVAQEGLHCEASSTYPGYLSAIWVNLT